MAAIVPNIADWRMVMKPALRKGAKDTRMRDRHEQAGTWKNRQQVTIMKWDKSEETLHRVMLAGLHGYSLRNEAGSGNL
jgi:hypothetical protein